MDDLIIYNTDDGETNVSLLAKDGTVWCTQAQMAELFGRQQPTISKHIANILNDGELDEKRNIHFMNIANRAFIFLQGGCHDSESYKFKISQNGYEIIRGARLKELFRAIDNLKAPDIDVGSISNRTSQISLFDFKACFNSDSAIFSIFPTVSYFI